MDARVLKLYLENYEKVLEVKASTLTKDNRQKLLDLDHWYQHELPASIQQRKIRCITYAELCKLMQWKLMRGKFRPKLQEMVESNKAQLVLDASQSAFDLLPDVERALKALMVLKAVGPATASAILSAGSPDQVPFMSDESMTAALPGRDKAYTITYFADYLEAVKKLVTRLNEQDSVPWTPHDVELALWSKSVASSLGVDIDVKGQQPSPKRKRQKGKGLGGGNGPEKEELESDSNHGNQKRKKKKKEEEEKGEGDVLDEMKKEEN